MSIYNFDGLVSFIAGLKKRFNKSNLLLTVTINNVFFVSDFFNYETDQMLRLSKLVEFINFVQDYNYRINLATKSMELSNVQNKIEKLIKCGVSPKKIVMGIHFTGPGFLVTSSGKSNFQQIHRYEAICTEMLDEPLKWEKSISSSGISILTKYGTTNMVIILENSRSIANKVRFAMKRGLAGVSPFFIFADDVSGKCGIEADTFNDFKPAGGMALNIPKRTQPEFPFFRTIREAIDVTLQEMTEEAKIQEVTTEPMMIPQSSSTEHTITEHTIPAPPSSIEVIEETTTAQSITQSSVIDDNEETFGSKPIPTEQDEITSFETQPQHSTLAIKNKKVICTVLSQTNSIVRHSEFDIKQVDWNLCTHVISVSDDDIDGNNLFNFHLIKFILYFFMNQHIISLKQINGNQQE